MTNIKNYQTIVRPIVTEKSSLGSEYNQVTFQVSNDSSKKDIKEAIENIFKVKVKKVNTLIVKGKRKAFRGTLGRRSDYKKAFITLESGQTIDINAGI
jgi:large subunit ribosomal protein L23